ncbi:flippase activity-associated protein Agl23 [Haloarchaeobius amylolyticus]|uniref:flippase activity-associated protein Agl23 n=1 Tax=Haloarchaeobius amylolyticus TaxID=1198296 RepID=UPI00226F0E9F|nr:flippase activity-associated protein Agl23 [Haloarchaeobius amylolyticus]
MAADPVGTDEHAGGPGGTETGETTDRLLDAVRLRTPERTATANRWLLWGLLAITALALAGRLLWLGRRPAHWSEARLGYGVLTYVETGAWTYRPVMQGPLLAHANELLFSAFGPSDALLRLVVAVVGGLVPLTAWLFRDHLRDGEVLAFGGFLAATPALVYYSRFARADVLVAGFALLTLGLLVRLAETRSPWYLYAAAVGAALMVASQETALLYVGTWAVAGLLVLDHRLFWRHPDYDPVEDGANPVPGWLAERVDGPVGLVALLNPVVVALFVESRFLAIVLLLVAIRGTLWVVPGDGEGFDVSVLVGAAGVLALLGGVGSILLVYTLTWTVLAGYVLAVVFRGSDVGRALHRWRAPTVFAAVLFVLVTVLLFAPRGSDGLGAALTDPALLPGVVEAALFDSWADLSALYLGNAQDLSFLDSFVFFAQALRGGAFVLLLFAVVGFLADRYGAGAQRDLVSFASYWGFAGVLAYPVLVAVKGQWATAHMLVPLAIPAAVGVGVVWRWGRHAVADRRMVSASLVVVVLVFTVGLSGATVATTVYDYPTSAENPLVQGGQPGTGIEPVAAAIETAAAENQGGPDVVYYGSFFAMDNESAADSLPVTNGAGWRNGSWTVYAENENWYHRLPLPWYTARAGAETASVRNVSELEAHLDSNPPVVVTRVTNTKAVGDALPAGYDRHAFNLTAGDTVTVVFVNTSVSDDRQSVHVDA